MLKGTKKHEEILSKYKTLTEYGWYQFKKDLYKGIKIELQEVAVCSPKYGFHGIIDNFTIEYTKEGIINVSILDVKPVFTKKYYKQISVYGICMSDPDVMVCIEQPFIRKKGKKRVAQRLYPKKEFSLNIDLILQFYAKVGIWKTKFIENSVMTNFSKGVCASIIKSANIRKALHKHGIYYLNETPPCSFCKKNEDWCSLYNVCSKIDYKPRIKSHQTYHGKNKLLVKTKPKIKR